MMRTIERSAERDAALVAMLPLVAEQGWTDRALRSALTATGQPADAAGWLFAGSTDMVEAYLDFADRRMADGMAADAGFAGLSLTRRVRALIALRLAQAADEKEPSRRAAALLALPTNAPAASRTLARTVDAIWHEAGDRSVDTSWYTKRAILAAVYGATLLHWLGRDDDLATLAFLDRRLAGVGRIGRARGRIDAWLAGLLPQVLRENPPTTETGPAAGHP